MAPAAASLQLPVLAWLVLLAAALALGAGLALILLRFRRKGREGAWSRSASQGQGTEQDREHRRANAILRIGSQLNATLSADRVYDLVIDLGYETLADGTVARGGLAGALLLQEGDGLHLVAGRAMSPQDMGAALEGEAGLLAETLISGHPRLLQSPSNDPELGGLRTLQDASSVACIPLLSEGDPHGALLFVHPQPEFFDERRLELLQAVGEQASAALQNARRYRGLEQERDRITETEEEARKKLARDLHDGPTQTIAAIAMRLNFARRLIERDPEAAGEEVEKLEDIARQTTREIRHMLFTLRPLVLESKGLVAALHQLASKMEETHGQVVAVDADPGVAEGLDLRVQAVAFFIAEEAINNARKHAESEHIWVRLHKAGERLILEVQDDGVGFNVGAVDAHYEQRGSLGMVNMRERAEHIAAALRIESSEGKGTHLTLELPLASTERRAEAEPT